MINMFRWFVSSLRTKMLTMFLVLTTIPLLTVGLTSYQKSFQTISKHSEAATMYVADELARSVDILFQDASRLLDLEKNPAVLQFLFSQTDSYEDAKEILRAFDLYRKIYAYENVLNISMVNIYGRGISERKGVFALDRNPLRNPHFQALLQHPDDKLVVPPSDAHELDRLDGFVYADGNVISLMGTVKQRITHEVIGFIVIDLNGAIVEQFADAYTIGKSGYFIVADKSGEQLYPRNETSSSYSEDFNIPQDIKGSFVYTENGQSVFVTHTTSAATNWKIVGIAPLREIVKDAYNIRQMIVGTTGLSIALIIALYFLITSRLTRPIQVLQNKMRQAASGYMAAKVRPSGSDELADLGVSFNTMLEQINTLMDRSLAEQKQLQKAELRTLQAQIHPHFLYNTMDSIVWMAEAGKNEQVITLVTALSRFFRISLSKGRDWITIREELEHVRNYLVIQQVRYRDILDYAIDVDEPVMGHTILKMTLQPLVENALYHGIKNKRGRGRIRIKGSIVNSAIVLTVTDDGIGIAPETLAALRARIDNGSPEPEDGEHSSGFGIFNVAQRIRLYYGTDYGIRIDSASGAGTRVSVCIPLHSEEEGPA